MIFEDGRSNSAINLDQREEGAILLTSAEPAASRMPQLDQDLLPRIKSMHQHAALIADFHSRCSGSNDILEFRAGKDILSIIPEASADTESLVYIQLGKLEGYLTDSGRFLNSEKKQLMTLSEECRKALGIAEEFLEREVARIEVNRDEHAMRQELGELQVPLQDMTDEEQALFIITDGLLSKDFEQNIEALRDATEFVQLLGPVEELDPLKRELLCIMAEDAIRLFCRPEADTVDRMLTEDSEQLCQGVRELINSFGKTGLEWVSDYCGRLDFEGAAKSGSRAEQHAHRCALDLLVDTTERMFRDDSFDVWAAEWRGPAAQIERALPIVKESERKYHRAIVSALEDRIQNRPQAAPFPGRNY